MKYGKYLLFCLPLLFAACGGEQQTSTQGNSASSTATSTSTGVPASDLNLSTLFKIMPEDYKQVPMAAYDDLVMTSFYTDNVFEYGLKEEKDLFTVSASNMDEAYTMYYRLWLTESKNPIVAVIRVDSGYEGGDSEASEPSIESFKLYSYDGSEWADETANRFPSLADALSQKPKLDITPTSLELISDKGISSFAWNGESLIVQSQTRYKMQQLKDSRVYQTDFMSVELAEVPSRRYKKLELLESDFAKGTLSRNSIEFLYPSGIENPLMEDYSSGNFTSISNATTIGFQRFGPYTVYAYSFPCDQMEGIEGDRMVFRVQRYNNWIREYSYMTGVGRGANITRHESNFEWLIDGFMVEVSDIGVWGALEPCISGTKLDMACESFTNRKLQFHIDEEMMVDLIDLKKEKTLLPSKELISQAEDIQDFDQFISDNLYEDVELSEEDRKTLKIELLQTKIKKYATPIKFTEDRDYTEILNQLVADRPDLSFKQVGEINFVKIYQLSERQKSAVVFFNSLNEHFYGGDYDDNLLEDLLSKGVDHFSLVSGFVQWQEDITGNGTPELLINSVSNYRTSYAGITDLYQVTNAQMVQPMGLYIPSAYEGGECKQLQGSGSFVTLTEDGLEVKDEMGGYDCNNQNHRTYKRLYKWNTSTNQLERAPLPANYANFLDWAYNYNFQKMEYAPNDETEKWASFLPEANLLPVGYKKVDNRDVLILFDRTYWGEPAWNYHIAIYEDEQVLKLSPLTEGEDLACEPPTVSFSDRGKIQVIYPGCNSSNGEPSGDERRPEKVEVYSIGPDGSISLEAS